MKANRVHSTELLVWHGLDFQEEIECLLGTQTHLFKIHLLCFSGPFWARFAGNDSLRSEKDTHLPESSQTTPSYWLMHHFSRKTLWLPHISLPLWACYSNVTSLRIKHWCLVRWEVERGGSCSHCSCLCKWRPFKDMIQTVHMALQENSPQHCAVCCLLSAFITPAGFRFQFSASSQSCCPFHRNYLI